MFPRTLLDGAYTGFMSACDVAGNCADGSTFLINVDTVAPVLNAASVAAYRKPVGHGHVGQHQFDLQDPNPNAVTVSGIDRAYAFIQGASASAPSVSAMTNSSYAATSCTSTCSLSFDRTLSEGNWSIWYLAYDEAGNQLGPLAVQDFLLVDLSGPSTSTPSFSTTLTNQSTLDVLWPAATDALSGVDGYRVRLINAATGSNVSSALVSNLSRTFSGLSDGVYRACVTAYDAVGNFGSERCTSSTSRIDTVNPVLSATSNISGWSGTNSVRLTWNASDDSNNVVVRFLQGSSWSQPFPANHSLVMSNLAEGLHTVRSRPTTVLETSKACCFLLESTFPTQPSPSFMLGVLAGRAMRRTNSRGTPPMRTAALRPCPCTWTEWSTTAICPQQERSTFHSGADSMKLNSS